MESKNSRSLFFVHFLVTLCWETGSMLMRNVTSTDPPRGNFESHTISFSYFLFVHLPLPFLSFFFWPAVCSDRQHRIMWTDNVDANLHSPCLHVIVNLFLFHSVSPFFLHLCSCSYSFRFLSLSLFLLISTFLLFPMQTLSIGRRGFGLYHVLLFDFDRRDLLSAGPGRDIGYRPAQHLLLAHAVGRRQVAAHGGPSQQHPTGWNRPTDFHRTARGKNAWLSYIVFIGLESHDIQ